MLASPCTASSHTLEDNATSNAPLLAYAHACHVCMRNTSNRRLALRPNACMHTLPPDLLQFSRSACLRHESTASWSPVCHRPSVSKVRVGGPIGDAQGRSLEPKMAATSRLVSLSQPSRPGRLGMSTPHRILYFTPQLKCPPDWLDYRRLPGYTSSRAFESQRGQIRLTVWRATAQIPPICQHRRGLIRGLTVDGASRDNIHVVSIWRVWPRSDMASKASPQHALLWGEVDAPPRVARPRQLAKPMPFSNAHRCITPLLSASQDRNAPADVGTKHLKRSCPSPVAMHSALIARRSPPPWAPPPFHHVILSGTHNGGCEPHLACCTPPRIQPGDDEQPRRLKPDGNAWRQEARNAVLVSHPGKTMALSSQNEDLKKIGGGIT